MVLQNHCLKTNDKENKKSISECHQPNDTTLDIELKDNVKFKQSNRLQKK